MPTASGARRSARRHPRGSRQRRRAEAPRATRCAPYNDLAPSSRAPRKAPTSRRSSSSRSRNMGVLPPVPGFLAGLRELCDLARHPPDLRRGHDGLPRRYGGAQSSTASRPTSPARQGHRRRAAGRRLRRPARHHAAAGAARPGLSGGTLSGNPLAIGAGLATLKEIEVPGSTTSLAADDDSACRRPRGSRDARPASMLPRSRWAECSGSISRSTYLIRTTP